VDSGLVSLVRRDPPRTGASRDEVFAVVDAAFAQRRKGLRAALRVLAPVDRVDAALEAAGLAGSTRGEQLGVGDFARLADALAPVVRP
jgi:16S rRNA (adenine1518-N6/adenine1519-N6)-dimethyltransferase